MTSPNGGERWGPGTTHDVTWTQTGLEGTNVKIELMKKNGGLIPVRTIEPAVPAGQRTVSWTVPADLAPDTTSCVKITSLSNPSVWDVTDGYLEITPPPSLTVMSPNGDESWAEGTAHTITWTQTGLEGTTVNIELYKGWIARSPTRTIVHYIPADAGTFPWTVPANLAPDTDYWIRITCVTNSSFCDVSDRYLKITSAPSLNLATPNGGERWAAGTAHNVTWNQSGLEGTNVKIELVQDQGQFVLFTHMIVASVLADTGTFRWTIPTDITPGTNYRVRITSLDPTAAEDDTNGHLEITPTPSLTVTSPNGGEFWATGTAHTITWTQTRLAGTNVKIDLMKGALAIIPERTIATSLPADVGTVNWTIPVDLATDSTYWVRIISKDAFPIMDGTDGSLTIWQQVTPHPTVAPTVAPMKLIPGGISISRDLNTDGKYEDVNGNGRTDFNDVVLYFNQMDWIVENEPIVAFDFNGNSQIDFADVVALFNNF